MNENTSHADNLLPYGKILIAYPCREFSPCSAFQDAVHKLETVPGTLIPFQARTGVLPGARNRIVREAQRLGVEWVWMLDDDQIFDPTALKKLLAHGKDAVIGVALRRKAPFAPLLYDQIFEDGTAHQYYFKKNENGLVPMAGGGMGSLLVRRSVLDQIGEPWFSFERSRTNYDDYAEDFPFYRRLREVGTQLYADLNVRIGHQCSVFLWPARDQAGNWVTVMADDAPICSMPSADDPERRVIIP